MTINLYDDYDDDDVNDYIGNDIKHECYDDDDDDDDEEGGLECSGTECIARGASSRRPSQQGSIFFSSASRAEYFQTKYVGLIFIRG